MKARKKTGKAVARSRSRVTLEDLSPRANVKGGGGVFVGMADGSVRVTPPQDTVSVVFSKMEYRETH